jgi:hypothetical protein
MNEFSTLAEVDGIAHDGTEPCSYDCDNQADYQVRVSDGAYFAEFYACDRCSRQNKLWIKENDCLKTDGFAINAP